MRSDFLSRLCAAPLFLQYLIFIEGVYAQQSTSLPVAYTSRAADSLIALLDEASQITASAGDAIREMSGSASTAKSYFSTTAAANFKADSNSANANLATLVSELRKAQSQSRVKPLRDELGRFNTDFKALEVGLFDLYLLSTKDITDLFWTVSDGVMAGKNTVLNIQSTLETSIRNVTSDSEWRAVVLKRELLKEVVNQEMSRSLRISSLRSSIKPLLTASQLKFLGTTETERVYYQRYTDLISRALLCFQYLENGRNDSFPKSIPTASLNKFLSTASEFLKIQGKFSGLPTTAGSNVEKQIERLKELVWIFLPATSGKSPLQSAVDSLQLAISNPDLSNLENDLLNHGNLLSLFPSTEIARHRSLLQAGKNAFTKLRTHDITRSGFETLQADADSYFKQLADIADDMQGRLDNLGKIGDASPWAVVNSRIDGDFSEAIKLLDDFKRRVGNFEALIPLIRKDFVEPRQEVYRAALTLKDQLKEVKEEEDYFETKTLKELEGLATTYAGLAGTFLQSLEDLITKLTTAPNFVDENIGLIEKALDDVLKVMQASSSAWANLESSAKSINSNKAQVQGMVQQAVKESELASEAKEAAENNLLSVEERLDSVLDALEKAKDEKVEAVWLCNEKSAAVVGVDDSLIVPPTSIETVGPIVRVTKGTSNASSKRGVFLLSLSSIAIFNAL